MNIQGCVVSCRQFPPLPGIIGANIAYYARIPVVESFPQSPLTVTYPIPYRKAAFHFN